MRENRTCGSEGGEAQSLPYPYLKAERWRAHLLHGGRSWGRDRLGRRVDVP